MSINRNQFIKSIGLGAVIHLLESKALYETNSKKQSRYGLNNRQLNKTTSLLSQKRFNQGGHLDWFHLQALCTILMILRRCLSRLNL